MVISIQNVPPRAPLVYVRLPGRASISRPTNRHPHKVLKTLAVLLGEITTLYLLDQIGRYIMIKLVDLIKIANPTDAALILANKIAFNPEKAKSVWAQTYFEFAKNINHHLRNINNNLALYQFRPARLLEKRVKNKIRKLYISDWQDRVVEIWLNHTLSRALSTSLSKYSYAYRSDGIGLLDCQTDAIKAVKSSRFFIKRDIKSFYYTIDHDIMLERLATLVPADDPLFHILAQRIKYKYYDDQKLLHSKLGLPFGSAIACTLANIYLDDIDKEFEKKDVFYYRYADDFLISSADPIKTKACSALLDSMIEKKKLTFSPNKSFDYGFDEHLGFVYSNRLSYLGIEYWSNGVVRLPLEKRKKIINLVKAVITSKIYAIKKIRHHRGRAALLSRTITECLRSRIRSAAIIDYFLTHVEDEEQLKSMDRQISELIISASLGRNFRLAHYKLIPYSFLRKSGLISLLHRNRLLRSKEIKFSFLSLFNRMTVDKILKSIKRRCDRIELLKLQRAARKARYD